MPHRIGYPSWQSLGDNHGEPKAEWEDSPSMDRRLRQGYPTSSREEKGPMVDGCFLGCDVLSISKLSCRTAMITISSEDERVRQKLEKE